MMLFEISHRDRGSQARTGLLHLPHGTVDTPVFMPVGTNATVKAIGNAELEELGLNLILSNTYHLFLRPGLEVIESCGGLHAFMSWPGNILTDSGGYQVFSLAPFRKIVEQGVQFRSHLDGSRQQLSPEDVVDIQLHLGSDIMMCLDVCTPPGISEAEARKALELTGRWAERSAERWSGKGGISGGQLFGIIQGNFYEDLRAASAEQLLKLDFPGYAIGGLSVGEGFGEYRRFVALTARMIPERYPRYLMGVGTPEYILEAVEQGIDLFDCVFPTRTARNAQAFTREGPLSLKNESARLDQRPIDPDCSCRICRRYTRAYLRHLFKSKEILAAMLTTYHNLAFLKSLILSIRQAIREDDLKGFKERYLGRYLCRARGAQQMELHHPGRNAEYETGDSITRP